jgi:hypothetical protein
MVGGRRRIGKYIDRSMGKIILSIENTAVVHKMIILLS